MVNMTNSTNIHMRLVALKGCGVVPRTIRELCLAPCAESCLDGVGAGLVAQSTRGAEGDSSERHIDTVSSVPRTPKQEMIVEREMGDGYLEMMHRAEVLHLRRLGGEILSLACLGPLMSASRARIELRCGGPSPLGRCVNASLEGQDEKSEMIKQHIGHSCSLTETSQPLPYQSIESGPAGQHLLNHQNLTLQRAKSGR